MKGAKPVLGNRAWDQMRSSFSAAIDEYVAANSPWSRDALFNPLHVVNMFPNIEFIGEGSRMKWKPEQEGHCQIFLLALQARSKWSLSTRQIEIKDIRPYAWLTVPLPIADSSKETIAARLTDAESATLLRDRYRQLVGYLNGLEYEAVAGATVPVTVAVTPPAAGASLLEELQLTINGKSAKLSLPKGQNLAIKFDFPLTKAGTYFIVLESKDVMGLTRSLTSTINVAEPPPSPKLALQPTAAVPVATLPSPSKQYLSNRQLFELAAAEWCDQVMTSLPLPSRGSVTISSYDPRMCDELSWLMQGLLFDRCKARNLTVFQQQNRSADIIPSNCLSTANCSDVYIAYRLSRAHVLCEEGGPIVSRTAKITGDVQLLSGSDASVLGRTEANAEKTDVVTLPIRKMLIPDSHAIDITSFNFLTIIADEEAKAAAAAVEANRATAPVVKDVPEVPKRGGLFSFMQPPRAPKPPASERSEASQQLSP